MRGSRNFRQVGGGLGQSDKKSSDFFFFFFFFVLSLFYRSQMVNFKENYNFSRFQGGPTFSGGWGGGSNCLFPIETHITCDFPGGGPDPLFPPLDPHLYNNTLSNLSSIKKQLLLILKKSLLTEFEKKKKKKKDSQKGNDFLGYGLFWVGR